MPEVATFITPLLQKYLSQKDSEIYEVFYLDIPLSDPAVNYAVQLARELGFFYGALLVDRRGSDQLCSQRYDQNVVASNAMIIVSDEAQALFDFVLDHSKL